MIAYLRRVYDAVQGMESGIGKDIALLLFGCAVGLVPWFLEKGGIPVPKSLVMIGGWLTIAAIAWSSGRLLSIVEPDSFRRMTVSGLSILLLCLAVFSATWWGFRVYAPVSSVEPEHASVAAIFPTAKPNLKLSMYGANVFIPEAPDVRSKLTGIALNVKVWNIGGPTVVTEWNLFITAPGTVPVVAQLTRVPAHLRLGGPVNSAVIQGSDDLEPKTAQYCPRQGRIGCSGQGKPFVFNAVSPWSRRRSPWPLRSCPKRTAGLCWAETPRINAKPAIWRPSERLSNRYHHAAGDFPCPKERPPKPVLDKSENR